MKKINLTITGCMGRMGQQLVKSANKNKIFKLVSLTENRKINKKISGMIPEMNSLAAFEKTNVIEDSNCFILNTCHIRDKAKEKVYHEIGRVKK